MRAHWSIVLPAMALLLSCIATTATAILLPNIDSLPAPRQSRDRILICNTLSDIQSRSEAVLAKQVDAYVAACEAGFEVHVVIVTRSSNWTSAQHLFAPARNLCSRLQADMPVALSVHPSHLAARHREVFTTKLGKYDYYFSHEDDMLFKAHHFQYFRHWAHLLRASPLLHPGFMLYEVPVQHLTPESLLQYVPAVSLADWRADLHLFMWHDHLMAMFHVAYDSAYMLTNDQLKQLASYPAWAESINLPWDEFNVPFQGQFLSKHVHRVVPVAQLWRTVVHHTSNKYVHMGIDQSTEEAKIGNLTHLVRRKHGVDMSEVMLALRHCTGLALETPLLHPPFNASTFNISFHFNHAGDGASPHPCSVCLNSGQAADVRFSVGSPGGVAFRRDGTTTSLADITVTCTKSLSRQWSNGCGKDNDPCVKGGEAFWGPMLGAETSLERINIVHE